MINKSFFSNCCLGNKHTQILRISFFKKKSLILLISLTLRSAIYSKQKGFIQLQALSFAPECETNPSRACPNDFSKTDVHLCCEFNRHLDCPKVRLLN